MPKIDDIHLVFDANCAPRRVMGLFAVKWVSIVLHALDRWPGGRCRTGQLQRALPGISKKMLVQTLRDVEARGLVTRHVHSVVPPKVEYALTPLGKTFAEAVEMLYRWGEEHQGALDELETNMASAQALIEASGDEPASEEN
ncbi:transcriptional regulator [Pseudomonas frederiksbergensis]|jgi:DNA-binding HxlR family transcriptional regulator|uniref:Transcriptional regulator n=1 Tax=Pseudomonas frederiksbergensis TaxID=104087 RepID=A0A423K9I6_9PSED|nr:helix-turn-helix domain-containing protein [Pseudomonas frederiksbergensis]RON48564.1 transcriptional regulator [Pseudomonas frederiksbergensis]